MDPSRSRPADAARTSERPRHRIAVIDDDPILIAAQTELLENEGYAVESAETFADAAALLPRFRPQVVLLDYLMPDTTASHVVSVVRGVDPLAQVVLVTGATE